MKPRLASAGIFLFSLLLLMFLLVHPKEGLACAKEGMTLWLNTLIPTLLPFIILTSLLIHTGWIEKLLTPMRPLFQFTLGTSLYGGYVFLLGMLCGYPMGAKLASDFYRAGKIDKREAHYLTTFCNHASPAFLITYLGQHCLDGAMPTRWLLICPLAADLIGMLFFRFVIYRGRTASPAYNEKKETSAAASAGGILDVSIMNGFETITRLGGYILLFSILAGCIRCYWPFPPLYQYLLLGLTEITSGLSLLASSGLSVSARIVISVAAAASGGFCILAQTRSILDKDLSLLPYAASKCINGLLAGALSYLVLSQII